LFYIYYKLFVALKHFLLSDISFCGSRPVCSLHPASASQPSVFAASITKRQGCLLPAVLIVFAFSFYSFAFTADCSLPTFYCLCFCTFFVFTAHCLLIAAHCLLSTAFASVLSLLLLPTAYCLLPTAHCLLSTAFASVLSLFYCPLPTAH
jgi:hypothetical protein